MNKAILFLATLCVPFFLFAQEGGTLSGDIQTNVNFFQKDSSIGASGNPLYDNALTGSETWLSLRYNTGAWTFTLRADIFNNSNLNNPTAAYSAYGIGAYSISRDFNDLNITVGYIYDQIGTGLIFRSYEDRGLQIDNALQGVELKYKLTKNILLKAFTGQQKRLFEKFQPVVRGFTAKGDFSAGKVQLAPGVGVVDRTIDDATMKTIASNINGQELSTRFLPRYNTYALTAYNNLQYKNFSWYVEGAYKTHEAVVLDPLTNFLVDTTGNVEYTTISYGKKGFSVNIAAKRTENFQMLTSPLNQYNSNNAGRVNWQPPVALIRPERLISRYTPASQDLSEMATTVNANYVPNDSLSFVGTYTNINKLNNDKLYREAYFEANYSGIKSTIVQVGVQYMEYNQQVYQTSFPANQPMVYAVTPFTEITYRLSDLKSLRFEGQYMSTKQDYGSWAFALLEYNVSPHYSFSVSDMYNITPNYNNINVTKANHYYSVYSAFTKGPHRFTLAYVKQVGGINCTGGVCRYEPAFSGIRSTFSTSF